MAPFPFDVFLSHSSKDKAVVRQIAERLKADGLRVWFDEWEIQLGDLIGLSIERGLEQSRILVLVMSSNAFGSEWVTIERHTALFRDPSNKQRRFIPVRLGNVEIPDTLKQFAHLDWHTESDEPYFRLLNSCKPSANSSPKPTVHYSPYSGYSDCEEKSFEVDDTCPPPLSKLRKSPSDTKPIIGINVEYRSSRKDTPALVFLTAGYFDSLLKVGAIPIIIPPIDYKNDVQQILNFVDGLLFVGGADLDCRHDGFMLHPSMRLLETRREIFDRRLMDLAAERKMPVMGVGCGMQLLNVSQGGNLFLHISEDIPRALPHVDVMDSNHRHSLLAEKGTLMERVYGDQDVRVNSMHHMAINDVATGFAITARCPDGVIEAIESTLDDWFAFGVQFHPEAESASCLDSRIFEEYVAGIKQRITKNDRH